ncbi:MAG TPA: hypothetical protein VHD87_14890 [Acidimicrobiales bacterium]|nr:hypothetical protein [Acidimicrobiales bacterium]
MHIVTEGEDEQRGRWHGLGEALMPLVMVAGFAFLLWFGFVSLRTGSDRDPHVAASAHALRVESQALRRGAGETIASQTFVGKYVSEADCRSLVVLNAGDAAAVADRWYRRLLHRGWTLLISYDTTTASNDAIRALDPAHVDEVGAEGATLRIDERSYDQRPDIVRAAAIASGNARFELGDELSGDLTVAGSGPYSYRGCTDSRAVRTYAVPDGSSVVELELSAVWAH